ncbi:hypothetical protein BC938DRAFT_471617 [Jimgerdemannia flammicorona]|uniref:Uncharacterized protein n=1 Tax=Jimgerdemannia flammicorona TaxID=994334 RepID=A0A433Q7Q8_9FUNG|nr:hypothetical protein BC938DRAFT_471617 [Jimgerdemannia flammicorona]
MATPTPTTTITPLFGGAITAYIPPAFVDSSDFRKIPDNQEVYVDVATDQSIIIELLQMVEEAEGEGVAREKDINASVECALLCLGFGQVPFSAARGRQRRGRHPDHEHRDAEPGGGAQHATDQPDRPEPSHRPYILPKSLLSLSPTAIPILLTGTQSITKFNESGSEATNFVGILLAVIRLPQVTTDMVISYNLPLAIGPQSSSRVIAAARPASPEAGLEEFKRVLASLLIKDWGLFQ